MRLSLLISTSVLLGTVVHPAVARPRVTSTCLSLLAIGREAPAPRVESRGRSVVREVLSLVREAGSRESATVAPALNPDEPVRFDLDHRLAHAASVRRLEALTRDLTDPEIMKVVLFVSGSRDVAEVTDLVATYARDIDDVLDVHLRPAGDERTWIDGHSRTDIPSLPAEVQHVGATIRVPPKVLSLLTRMAGHKPLELDEMRLIVEHARTARTHGDLLLLDQAMYRDPGGEPRYVAVLRLRAERPTARVH